VFHSIGSAVQMIFSNKLALLIIRVSRCIHVNIRINRKHVKKMLICNSSLIDLTVQNGVKSIQTLTRAILLLIVNLQVYKKDVFRLSLDKIKHSGKTNRWITLAILKLIKRHFIW
jgi:hypothetical protein